MKKTLLFLVLGVFAIIAQVSAQINEGGIPLSFDPAYYSELSNQFVPIISLQAPDKSIITTQDSISLSQHNGLLRIGTLISADITPQNAGLLTTLSDGKRLWQLKIQVPGTRAMGLYYDQFQLPDGVQYFLSNSTGKQILGAYTSRQNPNDGIWANEKVQGEIISLELDIDAAIDISAIKMHINNIAVFDKATEYLNQYATISGANFKTTAVLMPYDSSSSCEVNAACASGYAQQKDATVHIEYLYPAAHPRYVYGATGVLMNNTSGNCSPLMLTASHVEPTNQTSNATFSNWIFYFNYQTPTCNYTGAQPSSSQSITGASFKARAAFDSSTNKINGDYLILQLSAQPPSAYNAYLAGWDRSDASTTVAGTFISFHHPGGDVKKVSTTSLVNPTGNFNGGGSNTHWSLTWLTGGTEEGSSGSGLFNSSGREIGILSGGYTNHPSCTATNSAGLEMSDFAVYSKFSNDWAYTVSGSIPLGNILDPAGTGATTLDGATACSPIATPIVKAVSAGVDLFPNPATDVVYATVSYSGAATISIDVYNVLGAHLFTLSAQQAATARYRLDMGKYPSGTYLLRFIVNNITTIKKLTLSK